MEVKQMAKRLNDYRVCRSYVAELRVLEKRSEDEEDADSGIRTIFGRPAVCEQRTTIFVPRSTKYPDGEFVEIIHKGAFDKTDLEDVRLFINHDTNKIPLARSRRNTENSTMRIGVDDEGLFFEADLDVLNNTEARSLYSAISRGDIDKMSFMFFVEPSGEKLENLPDGTIVRHIYEIKYVPEISIVNFPAYEGTSVDSRSLDSDRLVLDNARMLLESNENKRLLDLEKAKIKYLLKETK